MNFIQDKFNTQTEQTANLFIKIGYCHIYRNCPEEASKSLLEALKIILNLYGQNHLKTGQVLAIIGTLNFFCNRMDQAFQNFTLALQIYDKHPEAIAEEKASIYRILGNISEKKKNIDDAIKYYNASIQLYEKNYQVNIVQIYEIKRDLANILLSKGEYERAYNNASEAYSIAEQYMEKDPMALASLQETLGECSFEMKDENKCLQHLKKAQELYVEHLGVNNIKYAELQVKISLLEKK